MSSAGRKADAGVPGYLRWVNRPLGAALAGPAARIGLSPTQVTIASAGLSAGGLFLLFLAGEGPGWAGPCAAAALSAGYVLDSTDGILARRTGTGSRRGAWLDHTVDACRLPAFHLALVAYAGRHQLPCLAVAAELTALAVVTTFTAHLLASCLATTAAVEPAAGIGRSLLLIPVDTGTGHLLLVGLGTSWFVPAYLVLAAAQVLYVAPVLLRAWRRVAAADTP